MIGHIPRLPQLERKGEQAKFPASAFKRAGEILRISRFLDFAYGAGFQESEPLERSPIPRTGSRPRGDGVATGDSGTGKEKS